MHRAVPLPSAPASTVVRNRAPAQVIPVVIWRWAVGLFLLGPIFSPNGVTGERLTNEVYCAPAMTNRAVGGPVFQAASTRRMVERLADLRANLDVRGAIYANDERVKLIRKLLPTQMAPGPRGSLLADLANQLLLSGQPAEALDAYQALEDFSATNHMELSMDTRKGVRIGKATALLRLGEQENCLMSHNSKSCYLPLEPAGFHQLTRGSRGAITLFTEQLGMYPGDLSSRWLLNLAYMTLGEYPAKVPAAWLIPPQVFASDYALPRFPEIAGALGLDVDGLAGGCIIDDFDNDGFLDLIVSAMGLNSQLRYFHNDGDGHFTERTQEAGLQGLPV